MMGRRGGTKRNGRRHEKEASKQTAMATTTTTTTQEAPPPPLPTPPPKTPPPQQPQHHHPKSQQQPSLTESFSSTATKFVETLHHVNATSMEALQHLNAASAKAKMTLSSSSSPAAAAAAVVTHDRSIATTCSTATANTASSSNIDEDRKVFYVNVTVLDATILVRETVTQQLQDRTPKLMAPRRLTQKITAKVAQRVSHKISPSTVAGALSAKLVKRIPLAMLQKGLSVIAEQVFLQGAYLVLQLQIQRVDMVRLVKETKKKLEQGNDNDEEEEEDDDDDDDVSRTSQEMEALMAAEHAKAQAEAAAVAAPITRLAQSASAKVPGRVLEKYIDGFLTTGVAQATTKLQKDYLPLLVQGKVCDAMEELLRKKMNGQKMQTVVKVLSEEKQARYFFRHLLTLA